MLDRLIPSPSKIAPPLAIYDLRPKRLRNLNGTIRRPGINDDDLVNDILHATQTLSEEALLVLHDHAEAHADRQLHRLCGRRRQVEQQPSLPASKLRIAVVVNDL
ncbi:MAG TPA: hypothetical protein VGN14_18895 [Candidatus Elarobacter sp.]